MNRSIIRLVALLLLPALAGDPAIVMGSVGAGFHPRPQWEFNITQSIQMGDRHGGLPLQFSLFMSQALALPDDASVRPAGDSGAARLAELVALQGGHQPHPSAAPAAESVSRPESSSSAFVPFRTWFKEVDWEKFVKKGAIALDVDGNLLGRGETLDKYPEVRDALAYLLRRGVRVAILSGNSYTTLEERDVAPLRGALGEDTQALSRLTVYGNASTAKYQFDPKTGQSVLAQDYGQEFTMTQSEKDAVAEILREEGKHKFGLTEPQIREWLAWYEKQWGVKKKHMKAPWATGEPYDPPQIRDKVTQNKDGGDLVMPLVELRDQIISVLYLPGAPAGCAEVRPRLIERFRNDPRLARLTRLFDIRPGGLGTIDFAVAKGIALANYIASEGIEPHRVYYFGDEFYVKKIGDDELLGNDMSIRHPATRDIHLQAVNKTEDAHQKFPVSLTLGEGYSALWIGSEHPATHNALIQLANALRQNEDLPAAPAIVPAEEAGWLRQLLAGFPALHGKSWIAALPAEELRLLAADPEGGLKALLERHVVRLSHRDYAQLLQRIKAGLKDRRNSRVRIEELLLASPVSATTVSPVAPGVVRPGGPTAAVFAGEVEVRYPVPEWVAAYVVPQLESYERHAREQGSRLRVFIRNIGWPEEAKANEAFERWAAALPGQPAVQDVLTKAEWRTLLQRFFDQKILPPARKTGLDIAAACRSGKEDDMTAVALRPIFRWMARRRIEVFMSQPDFEAWRLTQISHLAPGRGPVESYLIQARAQLDLEERIERTQEQAFQRQRAAFAAPGAQLVQLTLNPLGQAWKPARPEADPPSIKALRARLEDRPLSSADEDLALLQVEPFELLVTAISRASAGLSPRAAIALAASLMCRWTRAELEEYLRASEEDRAQLLGDWLGAHATPAEKARINPFEDHPEYSLAGDDADLQELQNHVPPRLRSEVEHRWGEWREAAARGPEALWQVLMEYFSRDWVMGILEKHFSSPAGKTAEIAPHVRPRQAAPLEAFSVVRTVSGDRRAIIHFHPDALRILETENPGLQARVEKILTTRFSRLTEGLDYDALGAARTVIVVLGRPVLINGQLIAALKLKAAVYEPEWFRESFDMDAHADLLEPGGRPGRKGELMVAHIDQRGVYRPKHDHAVPTGSGLREKALNEAEVNLEAFQLGQRIGLPLAWVEFPDQRTAADEAVGAIVLGQPLTTKERTADAISKKLNEAYPRWKQGRLTEGEQRSFAASLEAIFEEQGQALADFARAGFIHTSFHLSNSSLTEDEVFIHDTEATRRRRALTPAQTLGYLVVALQHSLISAAALAKAPFVAALRGCWTEALLRGFFGLTSLPAELARLSAGDLQTLLDRSEMYNRPLIEMDDPVILHLRAWMETDGKPEHNHPFAAPAGGIRHPEHGTRGAA